MRLSSLTFTILELNSAFDTGKFDNLPMEEAIRHVEAGDVVAWLTDLGLDLSLLTPEAVKEYQAGLADINGAYAGKEYRKWGIQNRAFCLLIAWTNELIQRQNWQLTVRDEAA